jgi:hypothetical protein
MKPIPYKEHLILPFDNRAKVMIPHAVEFLHEGKPCLLVPHKVDETQVLRNLGYEVQPPIMTAYQWPGPTPFDAQRITASLITTNKRSFVFNGIGTGKTRAVLFAYDFLKQTDPGCGKLIVTAPLSTLRQTWAKEITLYFPHLSFEILHHALKHKRLEALNREADIYIINHDGVEVILAELMAKRKEFSMACLDELSIYKNPHTDMWKTTNCFIAEIDRVTGLSATPMPLAASDAYGQLKMLTPQALQGRSYTRFKERVMLRVSKFKWVNKRGAIDEVFKLFQPSVRFKRDECYDMPPCQIVNQEAMLSDEQRKFFIQMQNNCAVPEHNVLAVNAADQINKLLQISLGMLYDRDHNAIHLPVANRLQLLEDAIEQSDSKVIVFTPYKASLSRLVKHLSQRWSVDFVSGDVSPTKREQIFTQFMHSPNPHVIVAHPDCMSHGLTLTEASTIVWWGPPQSLETYEQANGRITRAGQRFSQLIINLMSTKLEQRIYKLLQQRANIQQALLDMFERQDIHDLL